MYRIGKWIFEHPVKACAIFFGSVILLVVVFSKLPSWVAILFECSLIIWLIAMFLKQSYRSKKEEEQMNNLTHDDFKKMYAEYEALVEEQIRLQNNDREYIYGKWIDEYHELFYIASSMLDRTKFTDFHIAACMIFALVQRGHPLSHVRFTYDCVRSLISKPRVYIRHVNYGGMITLEVNETLREVDMSIIEDKISVDEICKIIREVYLQDKNEHTLIELADFLKRLYKRCAIFGE